MIGERIKEIRVQNKMSQTELANKIGITRSSVNAWEMGISVPSLQYLLEMVKLFKVSSDYLLGLHDEVSISVGHLGADERRFALDLIGFLDRYREAMDLLHENGLYITDDTENPMLQIMCEPRQDKRGKNKD